MKKRIFLTLVIFLGLFCCDQSYSDQPSYPILKESTTLVNLNLLEQRDEKYVKFLSASVRISVKGSSGSGTICYFDEDSNWAYIVSCGHLWDGDKKYTPESNEKARITVWYHNNKKLEEPKNYEADVLFWSNARGYDSSLIRFKPDWTPNYFPIANSFKEIKGEKLNSLGCDGGKEVARYEVVFFENNPPDIITKLNSPRPGRSGGGLLTDEGNLVGICWGTSDTVSGNGIGYFTPISSIRKVFKENKHEWLIGIGQELDKIQIYDWNSPKTKYDKGFIPRPNFLLF